MVFFSQTLPKYYKQKNTHTKKKENPHSIVIIIEFLSIFFVAFCNFLNLNSLLLFGPTRFIFTAQEGEEENNLLVILYNKSVIIIGFFFNFNVNFDLTDLA